MTSYRASTETTSCGATGADVLDGGAGNDRASYSNASTGLTANLADPLQNTGDAQGDSYILIEGLQGSDFNDILVGDANNNFLIGGTSADVLNGGAGNDTADYRTSTSALIVDLAIPTNNTGDAAGDTYISIERIRGSDFNDHLSGNTGDNQLDGGAGADILDGRAGLDFARYQSAQAGVTASLANPAINTGDAAGDSYISIEGLIGSDFNDTLTGDGNDNYLDGAIGADVLNGGGGIDFARYQTATAGVTASLANPAINTGNATGDSYISIEGLIGSDFNDTLIGDGTNNRLQGNGGADVLNGGGGTDFARYQSATAGVIASLANPAINTGDAAGDSYISIEGIIGSDFNDTLTGDGNDNYLEGAIGADVLNGGGGIDVASYQTANAGVTASLANPAINTGDAAGDSYISIEALLGSDFNDTLIGDGTNNRLEGNGGADVLNGGGGIDFARYQTATAGVTASLANPAINTGDAAGDSYISIEGLIGSDFNDTLTGDGNDNYLDGAIGADVLNGGGGIDFARYQTATAGVTASLANPVTFNTGDAAGDSYISIEGLLGSDFNDTLIGDGTSNRLEGAGGADMLNGGGGTDFARYQSATAGVTASLANPAINTGDAAGDSYISIEGLIGSDFNDALFGDSNSNKLDGGLGADSLNGGLSFDYAAYQNSSAGLTASLASPAAANTGEAAGDNYTAIEGLIGSNFNDTLIGDSNLNILDGGLGADSLNGGSGFDYAAYQNSSSGLTASLISPATNNTGEAAGDTYTAIEGLIGSSFDDTLIGDLNSNWLVGGASADSLDGQAGIDYAAYFTASTGVTASLTNPASNTGDATGDSYLSIENLAGSNFNDTLIGDNGDNLLQGGLGADTLQGGIGNDTADYTNASTGITANLSNPANNTGEAAGDSYSSIEGLRGSNFADTLIGDNGDNVIEGQAGDDTLDGSDGNDTVGYIFATAGVTVSLALQGGVQNAVGAGNDTLSNFENLRGSGFNDTLIGDSNANILTGGFGADSLTGGLGADTFRYISTLDSQPNSSLRDTIIDFSHSEGDKIDFSSIPGIATQAFQPSPLLTATSPVAANNVAWFQDTAHNETIVYVNTTNASENAGGTNLEIHLTGIQTLTVSDFILHA